MNYIYSTLAAEFAFCTYIENELKHFKIQVNQALFDLIKASEVKMIPHDWTNLPNTLSCKYFMFKGNNVTCAL